MIANGGSYNLIGTAIVITAGSIKKPVRSREERLVDLIAKMPEIAAISLQMSLRPLTWAAMNATYESVKGLVSPKNTIPDKKADYKGLIQRWPAQLGRSAG
jgi:hypothetical protein